MTAPETEQETLDSTAEEITEAAEQAGLERKDESELTPPPTPEDIEASKPEGTDLVVRERDDVYRVMDRADEIQILDELQGRALKAMLYSFSQAGTKMTDLSYAGVREVVRTLNRDRYTAISIMPTPPSIEEVTEDGKDYYRVMVFAHDAATGSGQWGVAQEPKRMVKKDKSEVWDKFAVTKALNKAQRNAMKALLPLEFTETIKAQFLGDADKVEKLSGVSEEALRDLPPPLDDDLAKEIQKDIRDAYLELKAINPLLMLPARFNILMHEVAHDHDRMRDFLSHVQGEVEKAKAPK